eukprot:6156239-Pyramimonas_sp.AAC.1
MGVPQPWPGSGQARWHREDVRPRAARVPGCPEHPRRRPDDAGRRHGIPLARRAEGRQGEAPRESAGGALEAHVRGP